MDFFRKIDSARDLRYSEFFRSYRFVGEKDSRAAQKLSRNCEVILAMTIKIARSINVPYPLERLMLSVPFHE
jgi:hypothetical protein